ncbi:MAG: hypothetical protein IPN13_19750 [Bacteroidetes bacterium]|nr:hypothetical protein [Bacteroidota bacterium]
MKANRVYLLEIKDTTTHGKLKPVNRTIKTIVAQQELVNSNPKGTTKEYLVDKFKHNKKNDTYTCLKDKH